MGTIKTEVVMEWARIKKEKAEARMKHFDHVDEMNEDEERDEARQQQVINDMDALVVMLNLFS